jgi:crotonobetainyl-CoA:carnitine CoA-transferase CaiB-like acyl-CoA transferase
MGAPLDKVRILAIEQFGAGPFGTMHLADLGAEVIKIEDPVAGGDVGRYVPPHIGERDSLYFQSFNRNKLSLTLDLRKPQGRETFEDLVKVSDGVYNNLRGDLPRKLGLDYASLGPLNPRIVCCSLSGFGLTGPRAAEPGYDYLMQGYAGFMSLTGEPDAPPAKSGVSIVDFSGAFVSVLGLMLGLFQAQRTGKGCDVDVSLLDTAVSMLSYVGVFHLNKGYQPQRLPSSAHPSLYPSQVFRTRDDYIVIMCFKEKFWEHLCEKIGLPELLGDARFRRFSDRLEHKDELLPILQERLIERTTAEWLERLKGKVPCAPVNSVGQALQDEQVLAREMVIEVPSTQWGAVRQTGNPIKLSCADPRKQAAPGLGEHTEQVLKGVLGYSAERIEQLRVAGAIESDADKEIATAGDG